MLVMVAQPKGLDHMLVVVVHLIRLQHMLHRKTSEKEVNEVRDKKLVIVAIKEYVC